MKPALVMLTLLSGCASTSVLQRAQAAYAGARPAESLEWLASLEPHYTGMRPGERAQAYYLRGMSEFRLGERDDALHHLALARELLAAESTALTGDQRSLLERTLAELTPTTRTYHAAPAP